MLSLMDSDQNTCLPAADKEDEVIPINEPTTAGTLLPLGPPRLELAPGTFVELETSGRGKELVFLFELSSPRGGDLPAFFPKAPKFVNTPLTQDFFSLLD